jgi:PAS domain S-box-containing protein
LEAAAIAPSHLGCADPEVFDLIRDSVVAVDLSGRITAWNRASEVLYGWSRAQAIGALYEEILDDDRDWPEPANDAEAVGAEPTEKERERRTASGASIFVSVRRVQRRSVSGDPLGWLEIGTDLTALRRSQWLGRANQQRYENMFNAIPVAVTWVDYSEARALLAGWLGDSDADVGEWLTERPERVREMMRATYVVDINPFTLDMFRSPARDDMLGSIEAFWPDKNLPDYIDWVVSTLAGNHDFAREINQLTVDGVEMETWFTTRFAPGTLDQGRFVATLIDYREVKRREAAIRQGEAFYTDMFHGSAFSAWRLDATKALEIYASLRGEGVSDFRSQLEQDPALIWRLTEGIRVIDLNEMSVSLFEGRSRKSMIGSSITPLWRPEDLDPLVGGLEATFDGNESYKSSARMRTLSGAEIDVLFTLSWSGARHEAGELLLAVVDMTEKVQAENALVETQAALAHATRVSTLGELTASIAHEIKQPLAALTANGGATLLWLNRSPPDVGQARELVEVMIADARRASQVVTHVRSLASPQIGQYSRYSLSALVDEAMKLVAVQLQRDGVLTSLVLHPNLPDVLCDKVQIQQVVVNLALNASQAMAGRSTPRLTLRTSFGETGVMLRVEDSGPGIPEEDLEKLFGSFFTTKPDGMGIGLAICRTIVEAHGGAISAHNLDLGGACFEVNLPLADPDS